MIARPIAVEAEPIDMEPKSMLLRSPTAAWCRRGRKVSRTGKRDHGAKLVCRSRHNGSACGAQLRVERPTQALWIDGKWDDL